MKAAILVQKGKLRRVDIEWKLRTIENVKRDVKELRKTSLGRVLRVMSGVSSVWHKRNLTRGSLLPDGQCRKAIFSEAFLFRTQESAHGTVQYHKKLSDNEIFLL